MNTQVNRFCLSMSVLMLPLFSHAEVPHGYLNWQNEYFEKSGTYNDRVQLGMFFNNGLGFISEIRYNTKEGKKNNWDPSSFNNNGHGFSVLYRFKPMNDKRFWMEPMFWLDSTQYWSTYEYGVSLGYDFSKVWRVSYRFRYDMDKATAQSKKYGNDDRNNKRHDVWLDYRPEGVNFQYQLNLVYFDNSYLTWKNDDQNYRATVRVGYKWNSWFPYASISDEKGPNKKSSNRQVLYRTGLTYSF